MLLLLWWCCCCLTVDLMRCGSCCCWGNGTIVVANSWILKWQMFNHSLNSISILTFERSIASGSLVVLLEVREARLRSRVAISLLTELSSLILPEPETSSSLVSGITELLSELIIRMSTPLSWRGCVQAWLQSKLFTLVLGDVSLAIKSESRKSVKYFICMTIKLFIVSVVTTPESTDR